jgi:hypothetical protein
MKKIFFILGIALALNACNSMDSNYRDYLLDVEHYSPCVRNLQVTIPALYTISLAWENPPGDVAQKIKIVWGTEENESVTFNEMITGYTLENMEIKGYDISVYTIDRYGNLSIPITAVAFPGSQLNE